MDKKIENESRQLALLNALSEDNVDLEDVGVNQYLDHVFDFAGGEYLVLTEAEADAATRDAIEESLWAFSGDFIADHLADEVQESVVFNRDEFVSAIGAMQQSLCESANPLVRALIADFDEFVRSAVYADGRAHFLATYDHEEWDATAHGHEFVVYRVA